jgi:hypothetical protein
VEDDFEEVRSHFYGLLAEVVRDAHVAGRRCIAASLKPALQRRSNGGFSESRLGFETFRQFLRAAEAQGVITTRPSSGGDVEVALPAAQTSDPTVAGSAQGDPAIGPGQRIRPDLWRAWVEWSTDLARVFDRQTGEARLYPAEERPYEAEAWAALRREMRDNPARFVAIEPTTPEDTLQRMRQFAEEQSDSVRERLVAALGDEQPAARFTALVRSEPELAKAWHFVRAQQIAGAITEWCRRNDVNVDFLEAARPRAGRVPSMERREASSWGSEEELRELVLAAVRKMPVGDLLRLPIALEYLVTK